MSALRRAAASQPACTIPPTIVCNALDAYAAAHERTRRRTLARMGKLTTHVLDVAAGIPAAGMRVELHDTTVSPPRLLAARRTDEQGRCIPPLLEGDELRAGRYQLTFHAAEYFRSRGAQLPEPPFIDVVVIAFGVASPEQAYHVPLLVSPWCYSTYRGS